jgi:hypothetical protein
MTWEAVSSFLWAPSADGAIYFSPNLKKCPFKSFASTGSFFFFLQIVLERKPLAQFCPSMVSVHPAPSGPLCGMPHASSRLIIEYPDPVFPAGQRPQPHEPNNLLTLEVPAWGGGVR